uniref:Carboxypeptidase regulatory-like domain-containing protein n=1 Tax=Acidobacterium capsulatum TaxID=33075 RepID=A0A7V4XQZ9_9BACT
MLSRRSALRSILFSLIAILLAAAPVARAQSSGTWTIEGVVTNGSGQPLQGAIVYLKNTQTSNILTYISEKNGSFIFSYAPSGVDYSIWAAYKGKKGDTKSISSFDNRKTIHIDLRVK